MKQSGALENFVRDFAALVDTQPDEAAILSDGGRLLATLVANDDWLPEEFTRPHPQYYQQYLLHCDERERFCVVSFVWGPGQKTPVHDHTVWGLIGMLRGAERGARFALGEPGAAMQRLGEETLERGQVDRVSPAIGDIHQVANVHADQVSISIHVYGGDIGKIRRHVYDPQTGQVKEFVSGYSNAAGSVR